MAHKKPRAFLSDPTTKVGIPIHLVLYIFNTASLKICMIQKKCILFSTSKIINFVASFAKIKKHRKLRNWARFKQKNVA